MALNEGAWPGGGEPVGTRPDVWPDVRVEIDELDLTGVPPARRHQVAASFERNLVRLLADEPPRGLLSHAGAPGGPTADLGERRVGLAMDPGANPVLVGAALARSVHGVLVQRNRR